MDDAYAWGRIAAANALSDVYAMGGTPVVAVNLLAWPRDLLPMELAAEVLRGGLDIGREASCHVAGFRGRRVLWTGALFAESVRKRQPHNSVAPQENNEILNFPRMRHYQCLL